MHVQRSLEAGFTYIVIVDSCVENSSILFYIYTLKL
jgi:hypothetical protein